MDAYKITLEARIVDQSDSACAVLQGNNWSMDDAYVQCSAIFSIAASIHSEDRLPMVRVHKLTARGDAFSRDNVSLTYNAHSQQVPRPLLRLR